MSWRYKTARMRYKRRIRGSTLAQCWAAGCPSYRTPWLESEILAVDTETSALSPTEGELLSIGWVLISKGRIHLNSARHYLLNNRHGVGQSAVIHQLRDCELADGLDPHDMMQQFLAAAAGRVLLFHFAHLDLGFLNQVSRSLYGAPILLPSLDTLQIEHRKMARRGQTPERNSLQLSSCRRRYHLPDYPAHDALSDALATAELFIAQARFRSAEPDLRIKDICR